MAIAPIGALSNLTPIAPQTTVKPVEGAQGGGFNDTLTGALDKLNGMENKADDLGVQTATGQLTDVHDFMIASTQAQIATELTVAVRNKAVDAFTEIMRMQV
jgi:flagellar hook-basal body complex protein FliE